MQPTREIRVVRQGVALAQQGLDLFLLPDGRPAAKWGGLVFPIHMGDFIEVTEHGWPPSQCRLWEEEATRQRPVTIGDGTDSYVLVEGNAQTCSRVVRQLAEAGFEVLRSGPNLSGMAGDWFIRLGPMPAGGAQTLETILAEGTKPLATADDEENLRERLLIQALVNSQASRIRLSSELERARHTIAEISGTNSEREALARALEDTASRLAEVEVEAGALRAQLERTPVVTTQAKTNKLEMELEVAASALLPRLDFIGNSMWFISVELPDRAILWKALAALDRQDRGLPPAWKSVSGHSGWWERHFSTGQDNQGRIYARAFGAPARWQVLVSHKQDQPMDLKRIARM